MADSHDSITIDNWLSEQPDRVQEEWRLAEQELVRHLDTFVDQAELLPSTAHCVHAAVEASFSSGPHEPMDAAGLPRVTYALLHAQAVADRVRTSLARMETAIANLVEVRESSRLPKRVPVAWTSPDGGYITDKPFTLEGAAAEQESRDSV